MGHITQAKQLLKKEVSMYKKKWILETTDDERPVKKNEFYISPETGTPDRWPSPYPSYNAYPIVDCTEVCLNHSLALPCQICERIAKEYRESMAEWKEQGD